LQFFPPFLPHLPEELKLSQVPGWRNSPFGPEPSLSCGFRELLIANSASFCSTADVIMEWEVLQVCGVEFEFESAI
jgi:hypothetical protein